MERYDVAIIGTGPAGLSAAITLKLRNKNIILFGARNLSEKLMKAQEIQNYLGMPNSSGEELGKQFQRHLEQMDIAVTEEFITSIYDMGGYYGVIAKTNQTYEAKSVILATGVATVKSISGEEQYLGKGVSYCATCDAPLYRGKTVAVIGYGPKEEAEVDYLADVAAKIYYIPMYKGEIRAKDNVEIIEGKTLAVKGAVFADTLEVDEKSIAVDGVFVLRDQIAPSQLLGNLAMEKNHICVDRGMRTNLLGVFACGDVVGTPYQYMKAAGEGNVAALSVVNYLNKVE